MPYTMRRGLVLLLSASAVNALPSLPRRLGGLLSRRGGAAVAAQEDTSALLEKQMSAADAEDPLAVPPAAASAQEGGAPLLPALAARHGLCFRAPLRTCGAVPRALSAMAALLQDLALLPSR